LNFKKKAGYVSVARSMVVLSSYLGLFMQTQADHHIAGSCV